MQREIHMSSLVVHVRPDRLSKMIGQIEALGCEVPMTSESGKLVVTFEAEGSRELSETVSALQNLEDVLAATLVFHHYEPADDAEAASSEPRQTTQEAGP